MISGLIQRISNYENETIAQETHTHIQVVITLIQREKQMPALFKLRHLYAKQKNVRRKKKPETHTRVFHEHVIRFD